MIFVETRLKGAYVIEPERREDERGFFARTFCGKEFEQHGLNPTLVQCSISYNHTRGTLRGMHYQIQPHPESKLVRCTQGAIYDVIVDLRPESSTFKHWTAEELTSRNRRMLYIPEGFAHGFLSLVDETEVFYQISESFHPECSAGVRWNDPAFGIEWPEQVRTISKKDSEFPAFA